jgi:phosphohistidine phosphatase
MQLYLLRHGDAIESPTLQDRERPLTDGGIRQARAVGAFLRSLSIRAQVILHSPLLRARQTAELVHAAIHAGSIQVSEHLSPGSDPRNLILDLDALSVESLLLVGHQPFLGNLLTRLLGVTAEMRIEIKKGTLVALEIPRPVHSSVATLQWIVPVEQMMLIQ